MVFYVLIVVLLFVFVSECCLMCVMCVVYGVMSRVCCCGAVVFWLAVVVCVCRCVCVKMLVWSFVCYRVML